MKYAVPYEYVYPSRPLPLERTLRGTLGSFPAMVGVLNGRQLQIDGRAHVALSHSGRLRLSPALWTLKNNLSVRI